MVNNTNVKLSDATGQKITISNDVVDGLPEALEEIKILKEYIKYMAYSAK